jgi:hypothetical protein
MPGETKHKKIEYKGETADIVLMGKREKAAGYSGELFVTVVRYGPKEKAKYDVLPDSTSPSDLENLPPVKTFDNLSQAMTYALDMDHNKAKWKQEP